MIPHSQLLSPATLAFLGRPQKNFINNAFVDNSSGATLAVLDPATGREICTVPSASAADIDKAVQAAQRALDGAWGATTPAERGRLLWRLADLLEQHAQTAQELESLDVGKPLLETLVFDLPQAVEHLRYFAGWATKLYGQTIPSSLPGEALAYTRHEPVGVVAAITPWNFPLAIACWKLAPALACGNAVVLKPSELTPLSALFLAELVREAGFPPGALGVLVGTGLEAGKALVGHSGVQKVSFTGSPRVGREIMQSASADFKRITLELGGKSPNIILPDANLSEAIEGAMTAMFFNQGEACVAGSRLFVHTSQRRQILEALDTRAKQIVLGVGLDPTTQMGPLVSQAHFDRVQGFLSRASADGAEIITGGKQHGKEGYFLEPTILCAPDHLEIAKDEVFAPVLTVLEYENTEDLLRRANNSQYGLGAGIWTQDTKAGIRLAHRLKAGTVWINGYGMLEAALPWGGFKQSGIGREMGSYALEHYTEVKTVWVNLLG
jgi:acyl-CoA reductase-like NAD-dependent aldehyde dehydrogenase